MFKFKLLTGRHIDSDPKTGKDVIYNAGDKFVTAADLRLQNGGGGMTPKFEFLGEVHDGPTAGLKELPRKPASAARDSAGK